MVVMTGDDQIRSTAPPEDVSQEQTTPLGATATPPATDAPQDRHITRSKDTRQPAILELRTLLANIQMETDPDKLRMTDTHLERALANLEQAHTAYLLDNTLDGTTEPHANFIPDYRARALRIRDKMRHKLFSGPEVLRSGNTTTEDDVGSMASLATRFSSISTMSTATGVLHKLEQYRKKIKSIVQAVSIVLARPNLPARAIHMVQRQWEPVDQLMDDHMQVLDSAVELLGDTDQRVLELQPLTSEMMDMVEKVRQELTIASCITTTPTQPAAHNHDLYESAISHQPQPHNTAFIGPTPEQMRSSYLPLSAWPHTLEATQESPAPPPPTIPTQQTLPNHTTTGARPKTHLKLPQSKPPIFSGELLDYLPWRRLWKETMGEGFTDPVQLAQLKESLNKRAAEIVGLSAIRTMDNFWALMDDEYVNYNELARLAIADIKSVDRKDTRYIQIVKNKLLTYKTDLEQVGLAYRITSDEMVHEHWLPLLNTETRERWIQEEEGAPGPQWGKFEAFITRQAVAARTRERISQASQSATFRPGLKSCSKCKQTDHLSRACKTIFCAKCKIWHLKDKHTVGDISEGSYCTSCEAPHPFGKHTRPRRQSVNLSSATTCNRCQSINKNREVTCGACGTSAQTGTSLHCYDHCEAYAAAKPDERLRALNKFGDCTICLGRDHNAEGHKTRSIARGQNLIECGIKSCKSTQNASLHGGATHQSNHIQLHTRRANQTPSMPVSQSKAAQAEIRRGMDRASKKTREADIEAAQHLLDSPETTGDQVLLQVTTVPLVHGMDGQETETNVIFDNGSTCSLIARGLARQLNLRSKHITLIVNTVTGTSTIDSEYVVVEIKDKFGKIHLVRAYTVELVSEVVSVQIPSEIRELFSHQAQEGWPQERKGGDVLLLIGNEALSLHPSELERVGNIGVYDSLFSHTKLISGHHPALKGTSDILSKDCHFLRSSYLPTAQQCNRISAQQATFLAGEDMGEFTPKACNDCRKCLQCSFAVRATSRKEQMELSYISQGVRYDEATKRFQVSYPFLEDPKEALTDNRKQAIAYSISLEKTLSKKQLTDTFNEEFQKFVDNGSLSELSEDEMRNWTGPIHYLPMQMVHNEESATTPFRIVTNSSCKDPVTKKSLNDILAKGPNMLSDPWEILLRFRNYKYALATDVTKAYHQLRTGLVEKHTRRVLYRASPHEEWRTFGFECVSFGDRPAAAILEVSLREIAERFKHIDPEAALLMLIDRFVDDMPTGHNSIDTINRFRGKILDNYQTTGTLAAIFMQGGYILKVIVVNGDPPGPMVDKLGGAALGLPWDPTTDLITIPLRVNVTQRRRGKAVGPDLTKATIHELDEAALTRRICLSITMALYDPIGLITPLTLRLRKLLQDISKTDNSRKWDDILSLDELRVWRKILKEMVEVGSVTFNRACKPDDLDEQADITLILFFDGSNTGKAFVAYIRYSTRLGEFKVILLTSKAKLNPAGGQSTPRSELDGSTLSARAATNITRTLLDKISRVYILGDSTTILQSLKIGSIPFNEYFGNRLNEIAERIDALDDTIEVIWGHVSTTLNGADIASRPDASPTDLGPGSEWQVGPHFLTTPEESWPINTSLAGLPTEVPSEELRKQYKAHHPNHSAMVTTATTRQDCLDLSTMATDTSTWKELLRKTNTLLRWWSKTREHLLLRQQKMGLITYLQLELALAYMASDMALDVWMRHAGKDTLNMMKQGKLANLHIIVRNSIPLVQTRFKVKVKQFFGRTELPVVLANTRLGYLICEDAHNQCHRSGDMALTLTKQVAYVIGAKKILINIRRKCLVCQKEQVQAAKQQMGAFPEELQHPDPPFVKIGIDLAGPFNIKADIRRRSGRLADGKVKMYVVIFVCHATSACKLYLSRDYSAEGFLQAWAQHISDMGKPRLVYSDRGTQLVSAAGGLDPFDEEDVLDWEKMGQDTGVRWTFTPSQSQWRNGKAEAIVKGVKHSLRTTFKMPNMDYLDFNCILKQIAHLLNSRPVELMLGAYKRDGGGQELDSSLPDEFEPITPNDLLIGTGGTSSGPATFATIHGAKRLSYLQDRLAAWHKNFVLTCQDRLFVLPKQWSQRRTNFQEGDVVYMLKESLVGLTLKWAIIHKVHPDDAGVVRDVTVRYSNIRVGRDTVVSVYRRPGPFKFKQCAIQNLAMMYSKVDQELDKSRSLDSMGREIKDKESANVDIMVNETINKPITQHLATDVNIYCTRNIKTGRTLLTNSDESSSATTISAKGFPAPASRNFLQVTSKSLHQNTAVSSPGLNCVQSSPSDVQHSEHYEDHSVGILTNSNTLQVTSNNLVQDTVLSSPGSSTDCEEEPVRHSSNIWEEASMKENPSYYSSDSVSSLLPNFSTHVVDAAPAVQSEGDFITTINQVHAHHSYYMAITPTNSRSSKAPAVSSSHTQCVADAKQRGNDVLQVNSVRHKILDTAKFPHSPYMLAGEFGSAGRADCQDEEMPGHYSDHQTDCQKLRGRLLPGITLDSKQENPKEGQISPQVSHVSLKLPAVTTAFLSPGQIGNPRLELLPTTPTQQLALVQLHTHTRPVPIPSFVKQRDRLHHKVGHGHERLEDQQSGHVLEGGQLATRQSQQQRGDFLLSPGRVSHNLHCDSIPSLITAGQLGWIPASVYQQRPGCRHLLSENTIQIKPELAMAMKETVDVHYNFSMSFLRKLLHPPGSFATYGELFMVIDDSNTISVPFDLMAVGCYPQLSFVFPCSLQTIDTITDLLWTFLQHIPPYLGLVSYKFFHDEPMVAHMYIDGLNEMSLSHFIQEAQHRRVLMIVTKSHAIHTLGQISLPTS